MELEIDEKVDFDLASNAETTLEDIQGAFVSACANGTSISTLCEKSDNSPHQNSVLYHLGETFDFESVAQLGTTLLQKDVLDVLPE